MRRVAVQFIAEMAAFRRDTREGAADVRRLRDESRAAQAEVAKLGQVGEEAGRRLGDGLVRGADGRLRDARGRFVTAGSQAGKAFGDALVQDATGRLRSADGRFVSEGRRLGSSTSRGIASAIGDLPGVAVGGRAFLYLAGGVGVAVAALQAVPPVLSAIAGGLASIPGLAAGALGSIGTITLGGANFGGAVGEIFNPKAGGGGGGGGANQGAAQARALESAERNLARAQRDAKLAQLEVTQARREATRELRDMRIALGRVALDERSAALAVKQAEAELAALEKQAKARPNSVDPLELERARLAYDEAKQSVIEVSARAKDLREDQAAAAKAGVEGSDRVQAALRRQQDAAEAVIAATEAVTAAQESMAVSGAGGGSAVATAYDKLSRNARLTVDEIRRLKPELVGIQQLAQDRIFDGLNLEIRETAKVALPFARQQVIRFGDTWNQTFKQLLRLGRDKQFLSGFDAAMASSDRFFDGVNARIPTTGRALAHLADGSTVFIDRFGGRLLSYLDDFDSWIDRAAANGDLDRFFADAAEQAAALLDLSKELFVLVGRIGGMQSGSTLLRDMADAAERFNDNAQGMRNVEGIIATGNAAIEGMVDVLLVLGETLGDTLADEGTRQAVVMLFDVMHSGAEIVGGLAQAFGLLPDEVQGVALAGLGLALVGGRMITVFDKVESSVGKVGGRLRETGRAGTFTARALEGTTKWAGRATGALIALQAANAVLANFQKDLNPQIDAMGKGLANWGRDGLLAGEAARVLGDDMEKLNVGFKFLADSDNNRRNVTRWLQDTLEIIPGMKGMDTSLARTRERVQAFDSALAGLVQGGSAEQARDTFMRFAQAQAANGVSLAEVKAMFPQYAAALEVASGAQDRAADTAGEYNRRLREMADNALSSSDAQINLEDAYDRAAEAIRRHGAGLDLNTAAGRENQRNLNDIVRASNEAIDAKLQETGSVMQANDAYFEARRRLIDAAIAAGKTRTEAELLADQLLKFPQPKIEIRDNLETATERAKRLNAELNKIIKKADIRVGVEGGRGGFLERMGGIVEHARVGLLREAGVFSPTAPAQYAFAEPGTGGEAFIPKFGDRDRSIAIGRRAMDWYGMDVVPQGTASRAPTVIQARTTASIDYGRLAAALAARGGTGGAPGINVERLEVRAYSDRFSFQQVTDDLAYHGVH